MNNYSAQKQEFYLRYSNGEITSSELVRGISSIGPHYVWVWPRDVLLVLFIIVAACILPYRSDNV